MKSELSLVQLAQELERQQDAKKDYLVTETAMEARTVADDGGVRTVVRLLPTSVLDFSPEFR